jgi:hypothetical protein
MTTETITLDVATFRTPRPAHTPGNWSSCLCDKCWREYLDLCDQQDDLSNPAA